jgi:hypothetical protein
LQGTSAILALLLTAAGVVCAQDPASPTAPEVASAPAAADPNAPPPKTALWKRLVSVEAVTATLPAAIIQQFHDWPVEWGKRRDGFEKRTASLYGQFVVGVLIEDGVKAIHYEDTHYRRRGHGNFFGRTAYVVEHTVLARKRDGHLTTAWSVPATAYGSWAIATLWSPRELRTAGSIFEWGSAGLGGMAGANLLKEFWPDVKGVFHKKKPAGLVSRAR